MTGWVRKADMAPQARWASSGAISMGQSSLTVGRFVPDDPAGGIDWRTQAVADRAATGRKRIKSFCGAKPPRKLRWTDAGRCRLVVGYGDFTQDAGWRGR